MKAFFTEVKMFIFRPKTMDFNYYSPWFDFWESEKSWEESLSL